MANDQSESRWFRVNCDWWESEWLSVISAEAQLAWVKFLGRMKTHGFNGRLKKVGTALLAHQWMQGEESVRQMLKAGIMDGSIIDHESCWEVVGWAKFQGDTTNADRQRRFKEAKKTAKGNEDNALPPLDNGSNDNKDKDKDKDNNPYNPQGDGVTEDVPFVPPTVPEVYDYMASRGWPLNEAKLSSEEFVASGMAKGWNVGKTRTPMKDWKGAVRTWEINRKRNGMVTGTPGQPAPGYVKQKLSEVAVR